MPMVFGKMYPAPLRLTALGVLGCAGGEEPPEVTFEARDSAGVEIISSGPVDLQKTGPWTVGDLLLEIPEGDGDSPPFSSIRDAVPLPDGRIAASGNRSWQIWVFAPDGKHESTFTEIGEPPLEFKGPPMLALSPPDTLVVWDPGRYRLVWMSVQGAVYRQRDLAEAASALSHRFATEAFVWQLHREGSVLYDGMGRVTSSGEGLYETERRIILFDADRAEVLDFGTVVGLRGFEIENFGILDPFSPAVSVAPGPDPFRVALSSPEDREIRFYSSDGTLLRILRVPIPRTPVTPEVRQARRAFLEHWARRLRRLTPRDAAIMDEGMPVPDSLPAVGKLHRGADDNLWVGRRTTGDREIEYYDVFDPGGRWLSTVHTPSPLGRIVYIGEDLLLTVPHQAGGSSLCIYGLRKSGN